MSSRRTHSQAPGQRAQAAAIGERMGEANRTGNLAELHRVMLVAASTPQLAAAVWRHLAAELADQMASAAPGKPG